MIKQFSYSQALLALAIAFLAYSLFKFTLQVPAIISVIEKTTKTVDAVTPQVEDIINEVALVRLEVGKVRVLVSQQTPLILSQVQDSLPVVQQVVVESENYSRQLPTLLAKLTAIEQQVAKLQTAIPTILTRVDTVVKTTNDTTAEISLWRPQSVQYLKEIELSREYIPEYLFHIDNIIIDAKTVGKEASSGLVTGFFKGIISLPSEVVSGFSGIVAKNSLSAKYLTAEDVAIMQEKVVALLNESKQSKSVWQNVNSGNRGTIVKGKVTTQENQQCINIIFNNYFKKGNETLKELMCIDDKGLWKVI